MSSPVNETSVQDGKPVYKLEFVNDATTYRFTTASYSITDSNGTYTPVAMTLTNIITTNELSKNGVQVVLPRNNTLAQLFLGQSPELPTTLTIYRSHEPSAVGELYWKGRVVSSGSGRDTVELNCEDIFTSKQRMGLRARFHKSCRHSLYTGACGLSIDDFAVAATINAVSGLTISVDAITQSPALAADYFAGGIIRLANGSQRSIVSQSGWDLTLLSAFNDLSVGSPLPSCTLYPGCDHTTDDCNNRFNNLDNYGGFPYIPGKNPFRNSVQGSIV